MPLPKPNSGEEKKAFIERCMEDETMRKEYPDEKQRYAVCEKQWDTLKVGDRVLLMDRESFSITRREITDNGYMKVPGRVARTGIQKYLASELCLTDRKPNDIVTVYRPPEEVFNPESLRSYDNADVTNDHPPHMVDASTFKKVAVGQVISEGRQDGDFVEADLIIKDQSAIKDIEDGKVELSAGYEAEYVPDKGVTPQGESYDFIQRDIRINHVALVDKARAGNQARLYDSNRLEKTMSVNVTLDKNKVVEVEDKSTATLIQSTIDGLRQKVSDLEIEIEKEKEAKEKAEAEKEKKDEDLEEEKKKSSDEAIQSRVKDVIDTGALARKIAGDKFTCDSIDPLVIKREALKKARPSVDWDNKSEHYVQVAWDMESEKSEEERDEDKVKRSHDGLGKDIENLDKQYLTKDGKGKGTEAYDNFLSGKTLEGGNQ